jgi:hypothetical protein
MYTTTDTALVASRDRSRIPWACVSRDEPRTIVLYVLFCLACLVGSLAVADLAIVLLFRYG